MKTISFALGLLLILAYACSSPSAEAEKGPVVMVLEPDPNYAAEPAKKVVSSAPSDSLEQAIKDSIYFAEQAMHMARIEREAQAQIQQLLQLDKPNIRDYYLALPDAYIFDDCVEADYRTMERREKGIIEEILPVGYLKSRLPIEHIRYGLYKDRKQQRDIIACVMESSCGDYPCLPKEGFLVLDSDGNWQDVTSEVMSQDAQAANIWNSRFESFGSYYLELPKQGTDIQIMSCGQLDKDVPAQSLGSLKWQQGHFTASLNEIGKPLFARMDSFLHENSRHIRD